MDLRREFVALARFEGANRRELCRRFGISPTTGYKWLGRDSVEDRSRRPHASPLRTDQGIEESVVSLACKYPTWGARKLRKRLLVLGECPVPAPSTIVSILRRRNVARPLAGPAPAYRSFEHPEPNLLWQMDFKGHFPTVQQGRCHPLTLLDDHSRFLLTIQALGREDGQSVRDNLKRVFERYGLPWAILCDNGGPWGGGPLTRIAVWLMSLDVKVLHSRPYHPQTQGKLERFHKTLKADAIQNKSFPDLAACQCAFDSFRRCYNLERPH